MIILLNYMISLSF